MTVDPGDGREVNIQNSRGVQAGNHNVQWNVDYHISADSDVFISPDSYFDRFLRKAIIFHHRADLVGRPEDISKLNAALAPASGVKLIILSGPGGRGKSRVVLETLRAVVAAQPQRPVMVNAGVRSLRGSALGEIAGLPAVILIEDVQRDFSGLEIVLGHARHAGGAQILATCRPSAAGAIRETALMAGGGMRGSFLFL